MNNRGLHIFSRKLLNRLIQEIIDRSHTVAELRENIDGVLEYFSAQGIASFVKETMYMMWKKEGECDDERDAGRVE